MGFCQTRSRFCRTKYQLLFRCVSEYAMVQLEAVLCLIIQCKSEKRMRTYFGKELMETFLFANFRFIFAKLIFGWIYFRNRQRSLIAILQLRCRKYEKCLNFKPSCFHNFRMSSKKWTGFCELNKKIISHVYLRQKSLKNINIYLP